MGEGSEITTPRNVLPDQTIHVLVCTSLPSGIRVSQKEVSSQFLGDLGFDDAGTIIKDHNAHHNFPFLGVYVCRQSPYTNVNR